MILWRQSLWNTPTHFLQYFLQYDELMKFNPKVYNVCIGCVYYIPSICPDIGGENSFALRGCVISGNRLYRVSDKTPCIRSCKKHFTDIAISISLIMSFVFLRYRHLYFSGFVTCISEHQMDFFPSRSNGFVW